MPWIQSSQTSGARPRVMGWCLSLRQLAGACRWHGIARHQFRLLSSQLRWRLIDEDPWARLLVFHSKASVAER